MKLTIIGAGKLTASVLKGFLRSGIPATEITVVGRQGTDFSRVSKFGVATTTSLETVIDNDFLFLAVQPKHVGRMAQQIRQARYNFNKQKGRYPFPKVISVISNQSINEISKHTHLPHNSIVCVTMDTNVSIGKGLIPFTCADPALVSASIQLLKRLGEV